MGIPKARFELDRKHRAVSQTGDANRFLVRTERERVAKCT
jgi:hypothetical protein